MVDCMNILLCERKRLDMSIILCGINAKYIHTNLAIRYLKGMVKDTIEDVRIREFTINNSIQYILSELYKEKPEILCFSCYIWNIDMILILCKHVKMILPDTMIVLGGPEVSFDTKWLMEKNDSIDIVIIGEGEQVFKQLMECMVEDCDYTGIPNIAYRAKGEVFLSKPGCCEITMDSLPFPYDSEELDRDKIVYYESSRGCPFNCQYCLSSSTQGIRFLGIERVKRDLKYFLDMGVNQVKFVDRTFNANKKQAKEIIEFIMENNNDRTNFHFEIAADILDAEILDSIKLAPIGLFQFEIGVQSTNEDTLSVIDRKTNFGLIKSNVELIKGFGNIHQHLDLIVGLPKEDYFSFRKSFDDVFELRPDKLQLGFLKLLKGSGLRNRAEDLGYIYLDIPPYEVLETGVLSYGEIIRLKGVEEMVETYYNTGVFKSTINLILFNFYKSPFKFFEDLFKYWEKENLQHAFHSKNRIYEILIDFYNYKDFPGEDILKEVMKFDYLKNNRTSSLPHFFNRNNEPEFKNKCHKFLQNEDLVNKYVPSFINIPAKQIIKKVHFERFEYDVVEIDYNPQGVGEINKKSEIVLFDYEVGSMSLDYSKYYLIDVEMFDNIEN